MALNLKILKELGSAVGIDQIGIAGIKPPGYLSERLQKRRLEGRVSPFEEQDLTLRLKPQKLLAGCRSVIVLAVPYQIRPTASPALGPSKLCGRVARCASGPDYHFVAEEKARQVVELIESRGKTNFRHRILCDRSPLVERELALSAGLGFSGKNCTLINPVYGSYTALATVLTDLEPETGRHNSGSCGSCRLCLDSCPTRAITGAGILDYRRCLSYLTQAPGIFPRQYRPQLGNRIYGCDSCQECCPYNSEAEFAPFREAAAVFFPQEPLLLPLLRMTGKEFKTTIGFTSAGWRGKTTLQRNALIALGNLGDDQATGPLIELLKSDSRPVIRLHAAWALGRIGGGKAVFALQKSLGADPDNEVRNEAAASLNHSI